MRLAILIAASWAAGLLTAPASAAENARAQFVGPEGQEMGTVTLIQTPNDGVLVQVRATGLQPGEHGFHIHEVGECQPAFNAAGDHYNPDGRGHGFLAESGYHAGDLPNISSNSGGGAVTDIFTRQVSLNEDAPSTLFDENGSAFIIHENPDTYGEQAKAGGRVACGVVEPGTP